MHGGNAAALHAATYNRVARPSPVETTAVATIPSVAAMSAAVRPIHHVNHFPRKQLLMTEKSHPFKLRLTACLCAGILGAVSAFSSASAATAEAPLVL